MPRSAVARLAVSFALAWASSASAQEAPSLATLPPLPPPTTSESVPPIVRPLEPAPPAPIQYGSTEVRFEPNDPDVRLLARSGTVGVMTLTRFRHIWYYGRGRAYAYSPVCDGPCAVRFKPGEYHLALAKDGGLAIEAAPVLIAGPSTVRGEYVDRSGLRAAGTAIGIVGIVGGVAMLVVAGQESNATGTTQEALLGGGVAAILGGVILGTVLVLQRDDARFTVTPLVLPQVGATRESPTASRWATATPQGAAFAVRF